MAFQTQFTNRKYILLTKYFIVSSNYQKVKMVFTHKMVSAIFVCALTAFLAFSTCNQSPYQVKTVPKKIGERGILHRASEIVIKERDVTPSPKGQEKKEIAECLDTQGLLYTGKVVVDKDPMMLEPLKHIAKFAGKASSASRCARTDAKLTALRNHDFFRHI